MYSYVLLKAKLPAEALEVIAAHLHGFESGGVIRLILLDNDPLGTGFQCCIEHRRNVLHAVADRTELELAGFFLLLGLNADELVHVGRLTFLVEVLEVDDRCAAGVLLDVIDRSSPATLTPQISSSVWSRSAGISV